MQEVSEEEEGCERGVPHSMCPWLFFAPTLLRVEQVGVGFAGLGGEDSCLVQARSFGSLSLSLSVPLCLRLCPDCLLTWLLLLSDLITVYKSKSLL